LLGSCMTSGRESADEHIAMPCRSRCRAAVIEMISIGILIASVRRGNREAAARLIDHTGSQATKVLDLLARLRDSEIGNHIFSARFAGLPERRSCAFDDLLGNADELAVCPGLMLLALPCGHPLDLLHPTPRRSRPISEPLDTWGVPALQQGDRSGA
jgi:hypothetical protein